MSYRSIVLGIVLLVSIALVARADNAPDTLEFKDLIGHPERWPATIVLTADVNTHRGPIAKGTKLAVMDVVQKGVLIDAGHGLPMGLPAEKTNLVEAANEKWSKLTKEQRSLDAAAVMGDASLWPDTVKLRRSVTITGPFNLKKTFPPGTVCTVATFDEQGVYLLPQGSEEHINVKFAGTDMLDGARERAGMDRDKRPSKLINAVRDILLDASGKPTKLANLDDTKVFIFYFGANWCQPCHLFAPNLVKFVNDNAAANPHMTVILLDADEKDADMVEYMKDEKMTWSAIRNADWKASQIFLAQAHGAYPQLLIIDRWGKVLYNEIGAGPDDIKLHMQGLKKMADSGAAK